jgi:hypothetical protein
MRLGGGANILAPLPDKPLGMHRQTYYRLFGKAEAAQRRWIGFSRDYLRRHYPAVLRDESVSASTASHSGAEPRHAGSA